MTYYDYNIFIGYTIYFNIYLYDLMYIFFWRFHDLVVKSSCPFGSTHWSYPYVPWSSFFSW